MEVILDVEPTACQMRMARSRDPEKASPDSLSMSLRLARNADVQTADDRSLRDAQWGITFYENGSGNDLTKQHNAVGLVNYLAAMEPGIDDDGFPESCAAWANVDSQTFALLREMALAGKLPVVFRLRIEGMTYGWAPDGSEKVWDVKDHPNAIINEVEIIANLVDPPKVEMEGKEIDAFWTEPKPESAELSVMRGLVKSVEQVNSRIGWVVGLLVLTLAVVAFR